jgi:methyl-accepting chemotaxis protein
MTLAISLSTLVVIVMTVAARYFSRDLLDRDEAASFLRNQIITGVVCIVVVSLVVYWVAVSVTQPLRRTLAFLERLLDRDLSARLEVDGRDEVGRIGAGLNDMVEVLTEAISGMRTSAAELSRSGTHLGEVSSQLDGSARHTSAQAGTVSTAAQEVSTNIRTVAAGVDELTASIASIAQSATAAAQVAGDGVTVARETNTTVTRLGDSTSAIEDVVRTITAIAAQTNLLALNATIEAARAGESGKGFAVVAGEVKQLAQQTAEATEDITRRIAAIQDESRDAVVAISRIGEIVTEVSGLQNTIAAAVEEQTSVTGEIARSVTDTARSSNDIAAGIAQVADTAQAASSAASSTQQSAASVNGTAQELRRVVSRFVLAD